MAAVAVGDPWAKERLSKLYSEMTEDITKRIQDSIAAGLIRDVDPELVAIFNVLLDETVIHLASLDDKYPIRQLRFFMANMLYHAFLTEKGKKVFKIFDISKA